MKYIGKTPTYFKFEGKDIALGGDYKIAKGAPPSKERVIPECKEEKLLAKIAEKYPHLFDKKK